MKSKTYFGKDRSRELVRPEKNFKNHLNSKGATLLTFKGNFPGLPKVKSRKWGVLDFGCEWIFKNIFQNSKKALLCHKMLNFCISYDFYEFFAIKKTSCKVFLLSKVYLNFVFCFLYRMA